MGTTLAQAEAGMGVQSGDVGERTQLFGNDLVVGLNDSSDRAQQTHQQTTGFADGLMSPGRLRAG
jgi:flagellar basal body P-ring protein FlgI